MQNIFALSMLLLEVLSRTLPHFADCNPFTALSLLMATCCGFRRAWIVTLLGLFIGDGVLHLLHGYPWLGSWSWFTYSGMLAVLWFANKQLGPADISTRLVRNRCFSVIRCSHTSMYAALRFSKTNDFSRSLAKCQQVLLPVILLTTIGFWLWTNFGTWWLGGLYPHSVTGFWTCYIMALPFLGWSLLGNLLWSTIIFSLFIYVFQRYQKSSPRTSTLPQ